MPNLKELREKLNLTQKQIADETGCSESYYCLIENNSRKSSFTFQYEEFIMIE